MEKLQEFLNSEFDWKDMYDTIIVNIPSAFIEIKEGIIQPFECHSQFTISPNDYSIPTPIEKAIENGIIECVGGCYPLSGTEIQMLKRGATIMPVRNTKCLWTLYDKFQQEKQLAENINKFKDNSEFIELCWSISFVNKHNQRYSIPQEKYADFALKFNMQDFISTRATEKESYHFSLHYPKLFDEFLGYAILRKPIEETENLQDNIWDLIRVEGKELIIPTKDECAVTAKQWKDVKLKIENIGGVWVQNKNRFAFEFNPTNLFNRIKAGEKVNFFQDNQYFPTPLNVIDTLIKGLEFKGKKVCEPSAGNGIIAEIMQDKGANVDCVEYTSELREVLRSKGLNVVANDFLTFSPTEKYDLIVANPPFSKSKDIKHVRKMYDCLKSGGVLRSVMSTQWQTTENKTSIEFRKWVKELNAVVTDLGFGAFLESNTNTPTCIIEIVKKIDNGLF